MHCQPQSLLTLSSPQPSQNEGSSSAAPVPFQAYRDLREGWQQYEQQQFRLALQPFEAALRGFVQCQEPIGMGRALNGLSAVYLAMGSTPRSLAYSQAAIAILGETAARQDYALAMYQLGLSHRQMHHLVQHLVQATACFEEALNLFVSLGDRSHENSTLLQLGQLYGQQGQHLFALACYEALLDSLSQPESSTREAWLNRAVLRSLLELCVQTKGVEAAIAAYQSLLSRLLSSQSQEEIAHFFQPLGQGSESQRRYRLALGCDAQSPLP